MKWSDDETIIAYNNSSNANAIAIAIANTNTKTKANTSTNDNVYSENIAMDDRFYFATR